MTTTATALVAALALTVAGCGSDEPAAAREPWIVYQRFTNDDGFRLDVRLVRPDGTDDHPLLTERPGNQSHPDWSPDGTRIAYTVNGTQLWVVDADGTDATKLPIDCSLPCETLDDAAWSPDGRHIAFTREEFPQDEPPAFMIGTIDLTDDTVRTVYTAPPLQTSNHPRWSPDGTTIVFEATRFPAADAGPDGAALATISAVDPAATAEVITDWAMFAAYPDWSWVTDRIVFSTYDLGRRDAGDFTDPSPPSDLYVVRPDGSELTRLTENGSGTTLLRNGTASGPLSAQPTWSPDGESIILVQVDGSTWPGWSMATMKADGTGLQSAVGTEFVEGTHPRLQPLP